MKRNFQVKDLQAKIVQEEFEHRRLQNDNNRVQEELTKSVSRVYFIDLLLKFRFKIIRK